MSTDAFPEEWTQGRDEEAVSNHESDDVYVPVEEDVLTPRANDILDPLWDDAMQAAPNISRRDTNERSPLLLRPKVSFQGFPARRLSLPHSSPTMIRRVSTNSLDVKYHYRGNSTFGQTVSLNVMIISRRA